ncbi:metal ABC transporter permease [Tumebacillus sp. DT12]|uniref:Metal ABC transporter permease n=1 Tax=Tumebacillus lacus TaxID=2995335 RepID=A0ABT3X838_9BACL|nr:metal ABC transporter permease [Tumebacillus lacus]MCX7571765.1 metal ABC transporter permease [Tumebacillus lacus]
MESLWLILSDPNTRWVLAACVLLGLSSGVLGCFALLRKHSLLGDAFAHAALPGICIAFMLVGSKSITLFLIGAVVAGLLAAACIQAITRYSRIKEDTALGLVLSVFFGFGIVLLTKIQQSANGNQSGLDSFLFGKAASLVGTDVKVMMGVAAVLLFVCWLFFKEFKLLSFDPGFGRGLGLPMGLFNALLMLLIVLAVVIGLQAVGVVLMAAMLIIPALAARYWTERLDRMIVLAGLFGALSGAAGTLVSSLTYNMPTGPVIVLCATALFLLSLIVAPQRGLAVKGMRRIKLRSRIAEENLLQSLYDLAEKDLLAGRLRPGIGYRIAQLIERRPTAPKAALRTLRRLHRDGLVKRVGAAQGLETRWMLTDKGGELAYELTLHQRMWEIFNMYEGVLGSFKWDGRQGGLAEQLPPEVLQEVDRLLDAHELKPRLTFAGGGRA